MSSTFPRPKLGALTSLRFFAAAMIVLLHGATRYIGPSWLNEFALAQGVSFFFVLSGFVLAYNYPQLPDRAAVTRFYAARFARVWPLHVATMALMALFVAATWREIPPGQFLAVTLAHVTLTQAWIPVTSFLTPYNAPSWSLSVELFFYLVFPLLISGWARTRWWKLGLAAGGAFAMWVLATVIAGVDAELAGLRRNLAEVHPVGRLLEFVLGIWACDLYRRHGEGARARLGGANASALEVAVVVLAIASLWVSGQLAPWLGSGGATARTASVVIGTSGFSALAWALLIWVFAVGKGVPARALSTRPLIFLGEISYALYLVHMIFIRYREQNQGLFADLSPLALFVLYWAFALGLSAALYIAIERPWRDIIRRWAERRGEVRLAAGVRSLAIVAGIALLAVVTQPAAPLAQQLPGNGAPTMLLTQPVTFDAGFRLDRVEVLAGAAGHPELRFSWTALRDRPRDLKVAVHLLDADAKIVRQVDHALDKRAAPVAAGERWVSTTRAPYADFRRFDAIGVGLYSNAGLDVIVPASDAKTDWGGKRLLVPLAGR